MQRFDDLPAAHFTEIAKTCLDIARDVESDTRHEVEHKRPAVGGLVWDAVVAILTAIEVEHRGSSAFVTGRASVARTIVGRLEREYPEMQITRLMRHAYALHTLEHAGQMRRGTYVSVCHGTEWLLTTLTSLLPVELRIESQWLTWLRDVRETK